MNQYIQQADEFITKNISGITRRNRVVHRATNLFIQDPKNLKSLYTWVAPDIIKDETRANHYGVSIGTQIGWITSPKDKAFFSKVARIKIKIALSILPEIESFLGGKIGKPWNQNGIEVAWNI